MHIGINGQMLLIDEPAGPEVYTYHIIHALAQTDKQNFYTIYFTQEPPKKYFEKLTDGNPNFEYKVIRSFLSWTQVSLAIELIKNPVDLFFTAVHTMPVVRKKTMKVVGMIHGLEYTYSAVYNSLLGKFLVSKPEKYVARHADALIVPSEFTKKAILEQNWGVSEEKITVIPEGVDERFYKRPQNEIKIVKEKYGIENKKYLLFVSTIQPRKNLPKLVEALSKLAPRFNDVSLAVCGKLGWMYEESLNSPEKYGVKDRVDFIGRVDDEDLPALFSGSSAFVSASLEEGFGLPLLEAMACGIPCVVSDIPSFRHIGDDIVSFVDPKDARDIAVKLEQVLDNKAEMKNKLASAVTRAQDFSWKSAAGKTLSLFESV